jgi:hypothetical protein
MANEIYVAKVTDGVVVETFFIDSAYFNELGDGYITAGKQVAIGDRYTPEQGFVSLKPKNAPDNVDYDSVPPMPAPSFDGETFSLNPRTMAWESDQMNALRRERDRLLAESDFSQMPDFPDSAYKTAMAEYRQVLRNLPQAYALNPHEVNFPALPQSFDY